MKTTLQQEQINKLHQFGLDAVRLTDLLSILPKKITDRRHIYELRMGITDCLGGDECWYIKYVNPFLDTDDLESYGSATELIDAIYEMIIWLKQKENIAEL